MSVSTHVLDLTRGRPAVGVGVLLAALGGEGWREIGRATTDADGRVAAFPGADALESGIHRLRFETGDWFRGQGLQAFWPRVEIAFEVAAPEEHHHVPLLLSPYGYSTYRGS